jgi:hypothetical protein
MVSQLACPFFQNRSNQLFAPELHAVIPLNTIGLTPPEVGGYST